ncbi:RNA polymerase I-specific transcription initiation factor RRN3 [Frankliniella fusca]|uniref:RNA polymerase I-specific transcription initiation factor RRN3 n=1 Tax=Frankliniella fusca TaxID=407009 RepID=A0AAE1HZ26_9NEOP|nr:RNA polymerase I-specific transcription initiation factor RRN3 [Frankliniella fusca]
MSTIKEHRNSIGSHILRQAAVKKVDFQLPKNLKGTLLNFTNGLDHRPYKDLVCILRDSDVKDKELCLLLREAQDCVSLLDQNLGLFIQVLLIVKWAHRGPEAVAAFQSFLLDLCSAHSYHTKAVLDHLIVNFKGGSDDVTEWTSGMPTLEEERIFQNIHHVLKKLLRVIPMAGDILMSSIISAFPYLKRSTREHQAFVHNMLEILKYQPKFRKEFLHLITKKLVDLDTHAPRSEIEEAENDDAMDVDEDIFSLEQEQGMKHPIANTLDHLMMRLFTFIKNECVDPNTGEITLERSYSVYKDFQEVFERVILLTHNTHHVQFLMWYLCSLRPKLAEVYVKYLWRLVLSIHVAPVTRQSAAAYVSSFLARANFVKLDFLKSTLQEMSDWIHSYINNLDGQKTVEMRLHVLFYSVCQALFYLLCFRHKDLFRTKQNMVFLRGLNLTKMVTCTLNPLRVCLPELVKKFAAITRAYQLVYCNSVIERNARNSVPIVHDRNHVMHADQPSSLLETFFPFDPYKLKRSLSLIEPTYYVYQDDDINEETTEKADNDDDDFLPEVSASASFDDKRFTYSASPGFLHDHHSSTSSPRLRHLV